MIKRILNLSGVEVLSREEQIEIIGESSIQTDRNNCYARSNSNTRDYTGYTCVNVDPVCRLTIDGIICY